MHPVGLQSLRTFLHSFQGIPTTPTDTPQPLPFVLISPVLSLGGPHTPSGSEEEESLCEYMLQSHYTAFRIYRPQLTSIRGVYSGQHKRSVYCGQHKKSVAWPA